MKTFPYHALSRTYTLGTPRWRILDPGLASMQLGNGILRSRDVLGQATYAVDLNLHYLTEDDYVILSAFYIDHARGADEFYWSDPLIGPLAAAKFETYVCTFDPETPFVPVPRPDAQDRYDAQVTILPILPTESVATLVGHWLMNDDAANTTVADDTGNGNTGTASHNTDTLSVTGKLTDALEFITASSRYVSVVDDSDLRLSGGGTICMWVKWDGTLTASGGYVPTLISRASAEWKVELSTSGILISQIGTGDGNQTISSAGALVSGTWRHVAVVISGSAKAIYIDGVDSTDTEGDSRLPANTANALYIGSRLNTGGFFGGVLDDVRIYKRPLSAQEILAIYNGGSGTESEVVS